MTLNESLFFGKAKGRRSIKIQLMLLVEHLVTANYVWEGLPNEIEPDIPERTLFYFGEGLFYPIFGKYGFSQCVGNGSLNIYGRFLKYRPITYASSFNETFLVRPDFTNETSGDTLEAVLVRNNEQSMSTYTLVYPVIERLAELWTTMGIKASLSRVKAMIMADEDSAKVIRTAVEKILESPDIFAVVSPKKGGSNVFGEIKSEQIYTEYDPNKDWYDFDKTWSLLMTMCGVFSNSDQSKKERQLVDEVNANQEVITLVNDMPLRLREKACEDINKMFGLNLKVRLKHDIVQEENEKKRSALAKENAMGKSKLGEDEADA